MTIIKDPRVYSLFEKPYAMWTLMMVGSNRGISKADCMHSGAPESTVYRRICEQIEAGLIVEVKKWNFAKGLYLTDAGEEFERRLRSLYRTSHKFGNILSKENQI